MVNNLRLIQHCAEFRPLVEFKSIPRGARGIYALLKKRGRKKKVTRGDKFDVVYIGMSQTGMRSRLRDHVSRKEGLWTHFSAYAVWPNITDKEIRELEGLFRAIYRKDPRANKLAVQKGFVELKRIRDNSFDWR
ncbi:MAG: hypothetical protein ABSF75_02825 [Terracidiphilus sp.]|jgi:hypothetical protein